MTFVTPRPPRGAAGAALVPLMVWLVAVPAVAVGQAIPGAAPTHWAFESDQPQALLGFCLTATGDLDGDGFSDLLVGSPSPGTGREPGGKFFLFTGSPRGLSVSGRLVNFGTWQRSFVGRNIAWVPPAQRDAGPVFLLGAPGYSGPAANQGCLAWFRTAASSLVETAAWHTVYGSAGAMLGQEVCDAGDLNGDGYRDVLAGAPRLTQQHQREGAVWAFYGSANGFPSHASWQFQGGRPDAKIGAAVAGSGDVNGDGLADVLVGAAQYTVAAENDGKVWLFLGTSAGLKPQPAWTAHGVRGHGRFGASLAFLGDLNGDGFGDVAIGAPGTDRGQTTTGQVFVYFGSPRGLPDQPAWLLTGEQKAAGFGECLAGVGDINGDGLADLAVSAPHQSVTSLEQGRVYLYLGTSNSLAPHPALVVDGGIADGRFGRTLAPVGDVNRDGLADFGIGSPRWSSTAPNSGRVDVLFGSRTAYTQPSHWVVRGGELLRREQASAAAAAGRDAASVAPAAAAPAIYSNGSLPWSALVGLSLMGCAGWWFWWRRHRRQGATTTAVAVEAERARIARDLHDDLGARLTQLSLTDAGPGNDPAAAREMLRAMQEIVWAVSPENDTLEGLVGFIGQKADELLATAGLRCFRDFPLELPAVALDSAFRKNLFLAVREALTNVVKHAAATEVWLRVRIAGGKLVLEVEDNGRGSSESPAPAPAVHLPSGGNGLRNLRRRMEDLGGKLELHSRMGGGTRLTFEVALPVRH